MFDVVFSMPGPEAPTLTLSAKPLVQRGTNTIFEDDLICIVPSGTQPATMQARLLLSSGGAGSSAKWENVPQVQAGWCLHLPRGSVALEARARSITTQKVSEPSPRLQFDVRG